jgi:lipoprotein LprG
LAHIVDLQVRALSDAAWPTGGSPSRSPTRPRSGSARAPATTRHTGPGRCAGWCSARSATGWPGRCCPARCATAAGRHRRTEAKFAGTITGTVNGLTGNIAIICVGDQAWWKLFTPDYTPADLASVNAPNPCTLFHPETGIASLVAATTDPVAKGQTRSGKDVVTSYAGKLPGAPISELLHLGDGTGTYDVTFGITDAGELRQATMTGPFFAGATSTYTLTLSNYGKAVTITAPQ